MRRTAFVLLLLAALCCGATAAAVEQEDTTASQGVPAFPAPTEEDGRDGTTEGRQQLQLCEKLSLEALGPGIVGKDGTLRRIANWEQLSETERAVAWRRLRKRNEERLATLRQKAEAKEVAQQEQEQQQQAPGEGGEAAPGAAAAARDEL